MMRDAALATPARTAWTIKQLLRALANLAQHLNPQGRDLVAQLEVEVAKELAELLNATAVPFRVGLDLLGKSRTWFCEALSAGKLDVVRKHKRPLITVASLERVYQELLMAALASPARYQHNVSWRRTPPPKPRAGKASAAVVPLRATDRGQGR